MRKVTPWAVALVAALVLSACSLGECRLVCRQGSSVVYESPWTDAMVKKLEKSDQWYVPGTGYYTPTPGSVCYRELR